MAKVLPCKKPYEWEFNAEQMQLPAGQRAHDLAFKALIAKSDKVDTKKTLIGVLVSFPCNGDSAHYKVVKNEPLTMEHVPYNHAWRLPGYTEQDIDAEDIAIVVSMNRRERGGGKG